MKWLGAKLCWLVVGATSITCFFTSEGFKRDSAMQCEVYEQEVQSALVVMGEAMSAMNNWKYLDQTPFERQQLTQQAAGLVLAADVFLMNDQKRLARLCGQLITEIGSMAHS